MRDIYVRGVVLEFTSIYVPAPEVSFRHFVPHVLRHEAVHEAADLCWEGLLIAAGSVNRIAPCGRVVVVEEELADVCDVVQVGHSDLRQLFRGGKGLTSSR